jgi:ferric-dicitrate binding protein FerR (iron transport regulator)
VRWTLLERFLSGECDDAEHAQVERWAAAAPRNREILEALMAFIDRIEEVGPGHGEWERLRRAVEESGEG